MMKNYPTKSVHGVSLEKHCWNGYISSPFLPHSILVVSAGFLIPGLYIAWPQALEIDLFYGGGKKKAIGHGVKRTRTNVLFLPL